VKPWWHGEQQDAMQHPYGCNAWADEALYKLDGYVKSMDK
jgi:hypothetical protein